MRFLSKPDNQAQALSAICKGFVNLMLRNQLLAMLMSFDGVAAVAAGCGDASGDITLMSDHLIPM